MFESLKKGKEIIFYSPAEGECINITEVGDPVFSSKIMGDGVAFKLDGGMITAPCDCEISVIADTKHAIGIKTKNGIEALIHIGLDTVNLNGEGFEVFVCVGDKIKKGTPLIKADLELMKNKNINTITPLVITETLDYKLKILNTNSKVMNSKSKVIIFKK